MASKDVLTEKGAQCVIHIDQDTTDPIIHFTEETWAKVQTAKITRLKNIGSSKYSTLCHELGSEYNAKTDGYHSKCYKNFTATKKTKESSVSIVPIYSGVLRSDASSSVSTPSEVLDAVCIFCDHERKKIKGKHEYLSNVETFEAQETIKDSANILEDVEFLAKYESLDFIAKEAKYHESCKKNYIARSERIRKTSSAKKTELAEERNVHADAFKLLSEYISSFIINEQRCEFISSLLDQYRSIMTGFGIVDSSYTLQKLSERILDSFGSKLSISKSSNKEGTVLHLTSISSKEAVDSALELAKSGTHTITRAALKLRGIILDLMRASSKLPLMMTAEDIRKGQADIPLEVLKFFRVLSTGSEKPGPSESRSERYAWSAASDALFATSNGQLKPGKHLTLGIGVKSITGSKKVVNVLNHFGQCIHYNTCEEIETELARSIQSKNKSTPEGLQQCAGLCTGLAWDNYDELTETLSGAGTLHDTFGICYQNIPINDETPSSTPASNSDNIGSSETTPENMTNQQLSTSRSVRKKRSISVEPVDLVPYMKKPRISNFDFQIVSADEPNHLIQVMHRDQLWMISTKLCPDTPLWGGWNSLYTDDRLPLQKIGYMDNICKPITRLDVIAETLRITMKVADECQQPYGFATYDLAAAKLAIKVQDTDAPLYDKVFIMLGAFHSIMAYFGCLGTFIAESGGPEILIESGVLAPGSLNGFINGRHYNRCKRLHPILANALHMLHFERFIEENGPLTDEFTEGLSLLNTKQSGQVMQEFERSDPCIDLLNLYDEFSDKTREGVHGATAQFWMLYIDLVENYQLLSRAIRTNDFDLYVYCLFEITDIYFAMNHPNYARYMLLYGLRLLNINSTHPGAKEMLEGGALSIRRSSKSFTRSAIDIALEQTVNANAASRKCGITALTSSEEGRHCWMLTQSARSEVIGNLLSMANLRKKEDCIQELTNNRIRRDNEDQKKVMWQINETMNPFSGDHEDQNLYCLTTGKAVSESVKNDLLGCKKMGHMRCETFKKECLGDATRFEKAISRSKLKTFVSDGIKVKTTTKDKKIKEMRCTRDLFGRLLYLAFMDKDIQLSVVFEYPLTPVPLSLAHINGIRHTTRKPALMEKLEHRVVSEIPENISATAFDAVFILRSMVAIPDTMGNISMAILKRILVAPRVDFACDTYDDVPYIKDAEREQRGSNISNVEYHISGPEQKRPKDFDIKLNSPKFKRALIQFLLDDWKRNIHCDLLSGHKLLVGFEDQAWLYMVQDNEVCRIAVPELVCHHREADTRLVWHAKHISEELPNSNIVIRCNDTDILINFLPHVRSFSAHVWLDVGLSNKNTRRYIDVTALAEKLGPDLCSALPGFHHFTGADYTAAFYGKGKVRPLALMEKKFVKCFSRLGISEVLDPEMMIDLESFVCHMYNKTNATSVNDARYIQFLETFKPKDNSEPLKSLTGIDSSMLPPCKSVLVQKIKRSNYAASLCKGAILANPCTWDPEENGWKLANGKYMIKWFEGSEVPDNLCSHIDDDTLDPQDSDDPLVYNEDSDESDSES